MKQRLLAVFAHPDDEAFGTGGTLARYAAAGIDIALVCATRGEVGEIADESLATPDTLGQVRERELVCAADMLGVRDVVFLGYRDSGMAGTTDNGNSDAFVNAPAEEVVSRLVGIIRQWRPQVVVTFEPNGGYGHPDHIAAHRHTLAAFHAAADPSYNPVQGEAWQASRLFYTAIPRSFFVEMRDRLVAAGVDTSEFDRFEGDGIGWPDDQVNVMVDVAEEIEAKWAALNCHRTQFGPNNLFRRLSDEEIKQMLGREYFALAWPDPDPGLQLAGLFAGLRAGRTH